MNHRPDGAERVVRERWWRLDTPRLLVDLDRVEANIARFHASLRPGVAVRSHVKTHKCVELAGLQLAGGAVGITAAKVSEAEVFVDAGIDDVVVAYPVFGEAKWRRLAELATRCRLRAHVENERAVEGLAAAARERGVVLGVRVEVDSGLHRSGAPPAEAEALARLVAGTPGLALDGVTTFRSAFFPHPPGLDHADLGREEARAVVGVAERLRASGVDVPSVVAGSTPTGPAASQVEGITEVCAGTYVLNDAMLVEHGVVSWGDVAVSVSATVVSARGDRYTIDAGAKTLTKDVFPAGDRTVHGHVAGTGDVVLSLTDEHGIVEAAGRAPAVGDIVRVHPMHVCPVVNLADELVVTRGDEVVDRWAVAARGCNR